MTGQVRKSLRILLPLLLGVVLIVLLYRQVDFDVVRETLREDVRWEIIALSCLLGPLSVLCRGLRWDLQVQPLRAGTTPHRSTLALSLLHVQGSYAVNMAIPHLGDLWRCSSMASYSRLSFSQLLGTLIAERAIDMICTLLLIIPGLWLNARYFTSFLEAHVALSSGGTVLLLLVGGLLGVGLLWLLLRRTTVGRRLREGWRDFLVGLQTIREMGARRALLFLLYTVGIWVCYYYAFYLTFGAFSFTEGLGPEAALLIFSLITVSSILPVQGNIGPWHFVVIQSLIFFGVVADPAASFALIVHTSQTAVTTIVGLVALFTLPLLKDTQ